MLPLHRLILLASILSGCTERGAKPPLQEAGELRGARAAAVMLETGERESGSFVTRARGSGTVVSAEGDILTNHHVLVSSRTGRLYEEFRLSAYQGDEQVPRALCSGKSATGLLAPERDLALIRCDRSEEIDWMPIQLGNPGAPLPTAGEAIWLLGFSAERALTVHAGRIAPFASSASDGLLRSTAAVSHGMSGGSAIDAKGRLIAIPTGYREQRRRDAGGRIPQGRQGVLIPLREAVPLLEEAGLLRHRP